MSCLFGELIPERYIKKWFALKIDEFQLLIEEGWIRMENEDVRIIIPTIMILSLAKGRKEKEKLIDSISLLLKKISREIRGNETEELNNGQLGNIIATLLTSLNNFWDKLDVELKKRFENDLNDFYISCLNFIIDQNCFENAKKVLDTEVMKKKEDELSHLVTYVEMNLGNDNVWADYEKEKVLPLLRRINEDEETTLIEIGRDECIQHITLYQRFFNNLILNAFRKEVEWMELGNCSVKELPGEMIITALKDVKVYEKLLAEMNKRGYADFFTDNYYTDAIYILLYWGKENIQKGYCTSLCRIRYILEEKLLLFYGENLVKKGKQNLIDLLCDYICFAFIYVTFYNKIGSAYTETKDYRKQCLNEIERIFCEGKLRPIAQLLISEGCLSENNKFHIKMVQELCQKLLTIVS